MTQLTASTASTLKAELKARTELLPASLVTRLHRAISWLQAAEDASSVDFEFISLWISFNACCAIDQQGDQPLADHEQFVQFISQLVAQDKNRHIYACLWEEYSGHVKALVRNPYVFHSFWVSQRRGDNLWQQEFDQSSLKALNALSRQRVTELCTIVMDRLNVLHNQLIYGGATYKGRINREQVVDGAGLLESLMPVFIRLMLASPETDWGVIAYPVINT
ncbi:MAG: hypothetical protein P8X74_15900 [Reinekea sp.]|jgi:hypothetical protein